MVNWAGAIELNRNALYRIVAALFAMVGLDDSETVATLPRYLRNHVNRILRPAESAVRRLVIIAAWDMEVTLRPARERKGPLSRSVILGLDPGARQQAERSLKAGQITGRHSVKGKTAAKAKNLTLPLLDSLPDLSFRPRRRRPKAFPRISIIGITEPRPIPENWILSPDDPVDAAGLCRRLHALKRVLDDLDTQAKRFARWRARRDLNRTKRFNPLRPGRPPGHRKRPVHKVDDVLRECHSLALYAQRPDTS